MSAHCSLMHYTLLWHVAVAYPSLTDADSLAKGHV
jgi:hypothetical protein